MTKLIFITHPDVKRDPKVEAVNWEYSDVGKQDIQELMDKDFWTNVDAIYSSPQKKALDAATIVSQKFDIKVKVENELREMNRMSTGYLPYDLYMSAMREFYNNPSTSFKGWETAYEAQKRIVQCVSDIMREHTDQTVAVIGHGATGTLLKCHIKNVQPSMDEDPEGTAFIFEVDWDQKKIIQNWKKY